MKLQVNFKKIDCDFAISFKEQKNDFQVKFQNFQSVEIYDTPAYNGAYDVTPKVDEAQTLETKNKRMRDDVRVKAIPYYEVSNNDGVTVTIGKEVI